MKKYTVEKQKMSDSDPKKTLSLTEIQKSLADHYTAFIEDNPHPKGAFICLVNKEDSSVLVEGQMTVPEIAMSVITLIDSVEAAFPGFWETLIAYKLENQ